MIIPGTHAFTLLILILSTVCWGLWANTLRIAGPKWRFELFYLDFALGVVLAAIIAGLTLGSMGWDGFSLIDDLRIAGKRQELFAFVAGCVFNLANLLLVGAITLAGLAFSFPVTMGLALVAAATATMVLQPGPGRIFTVGGCVLVLAAVVLTLIAWRDRSAAQMAVLSDPAKPKAPKAKSAVKGIILALLAGILMASFYPLVSMARSGENGLGPYALVTVFAVGLFLSTLVYDLFFMNLPIQGKPVEIGHYFRGGLKQHAAGMLGGILWLTGMLATLVAARAEGPAQAGVIPVFVSGQVPALLAALCGIFAWKELSGAPTRAKALSAGALVLYMAGILTVALAYR